VGSRVHQPQNLAKVLTGKNHWVLPVNLSFDAIAQVCGEFAQRYPHPLAVFAHWQPGVLAVCLGIKGGFVRVGPGMSSGVATEAKMKIPQISLVHYVSRVSLRRDPSRYPFVCLFNAEYGVYGENVFFREVPTAEKNVGTL
jgi:hypothetical protein